MPNDATGVPEHLPQNDALGVSQIAGAAAFASVADWRRIDAWAHDGGRHRRCT